MTEVAATKSGAVDLELLVERHQRELLAICVAAGGDADAARDAVQSTWAIALMKLASVKPGSERGWLIRVAINELRQAHRRTRRNVNLSAIGETSRQSYGSFGDPDLHVALARLDRVDRSIIALSIVGGLTSEEIGPMVGMSAAGVRTRKARCLKQLREALRDD